MPKSIKSKPQWKRSVLLPYEDPIMNMRANGDSLSTIQARLKSRGVVVSKMTVKRFPRVYASWSTTAVDR